MNKSILLNTLWSVRKSTFFWSLALFFITLMTIGLFDSMAKQYADAFSEAGMPAGFEAFVGQIDSFSTPEGWLGVEVFSMVLPLSLAIIGIGAGASAIGREENSGTLELLLSSPISRGRIVIEKAGAVALQLAVVSLAVLGAVAIGTITFPFDISLTKTAEATFAGWLLGLFFAYIALAIQAINGNRGLAIGVGSGVLIAAYFVSTLAPMVESIEILKYGSAFYYYEGQNVLSEGLRLVNVAVLGFGIAILFIGSYIGFKNRDTGI